MIASHDALQDAIDRLNIATYKGNIDRVLTQLVEITNCAPGKLQDVISAALLEAGAGGQLKILEFLIQEGGDINIRDKRGCNILHRALKCGHLDIVKYCINVLKFNKNRTSNNGYTPLIHASYYGHVNIVEYLILIEVPLNEKDNWDYTAFMHACQRGHLQIVKILFANIQVEISQQSLILAAQEGHIQIVEYLIEKVLNLDINVKDCNELSSLSWACLKDDFPIIQLLIENGANVNNQDVDDVTPLMLVIQNKNIEIVNFLLVHGANINNCDSYKRDCITLAKQKKNIEIVSILEKWPIVMIILVWQELGVYYLFDCQSLIDLFLYF
jgi:ankyrin repeat protein